MRHSRLMILGLLALAVGQLYANGQTRYTAADAAADVIAVMDSGGDIGAAFDAAQSLFSATDPDDLSQQEANVRIQTAVVEALELRLATVQAQLERERAFLMELELELDAWIAAQEFVDAYENDGAGWVYGP